MAKPVARFFEAMYTANMDIDDLFIASGNKTKLVAVDGSSLDQVIIEGHNFKYEDGRLDSGIVEKFAIRDADGEILQTVTGIKIDASHLAGQDMYEFTNALITRVLYGGVKEIGTNVDDIIYGFNARDTLLGRGGDDQMSGAAGKDILTGGAGNDEFKFTDGMGRDTITDFDANGGVGAQDFIDGTYADATITQSGKNAIVDFGDGDVYVLLKVDAGDVTVDDFI